jgi:hypothetical protein
MPTFSVVDLMREIKGEGKYVLVMTHLGILSPAVENHEV